MGILESWNWHGSSNLGSQWYAYDIFTFKLDILNVALSDKKETQLRVINLWKLVWSMT